MHSNCRRTRARLFQVRLRDGLEPTLRIGVEDAGKIELATDIASNLVARRAVIAELLRSVRR